MNRINDHLSTLHNRGEKALALFLTAGFPEITSTPRLVRLLEKAGADIIELGMPFSDPIADGPIIQESSAMALTNGMTLRHILQNVREIRKTSGIPLVVMGYVNPILAYGPDKFFADASRAGVDGIVLPEVPLEETPRFSVLIEGNGLAGILLVTPTTGNERISRIDDASGGFVYCVSTTGVTGKSQGGTDREYIRRVKANVARNPVLVGFGISTPDDARASAREADGVIVGSALIKRFLAGEANDRIARWIERMKDAIG